MINRLILKIMHVCALDFCKKYFFVAKYKHQLLQLTICLEKVSIEATPSANTWGWVDDREQSVNLVPGGWTSDSDNNNFPKVCTLQNEYLEFCGAGHLLAGLHHAHRHQHRPGLVLGQDQRRVQRQEPQLHGAALRVPGVRQPRLQLHRYVRLPLRPAILLLQGHGQWHGPPGGLGN